MAHEARLTHSSDCTSAPPFDTSNATSATDRRLRFVVLQETPGIWLVRGLEHDVSVEARSIGGALRAAVGLVAAHTAFDRRHALSPLSAFPAAPQGYWNAYNAGTLVSLTQLGIASPGGWEISASISHRRP
jgi:hypothetical protein